MIEANLNVAGSYKFSIEPFNEGCMKDEFPTSPRAESGVSISITDNEVATSLSQKVRANFRHASPQTLHEHDNGAARYKTEKARAVWR